MKTTTCFDVFEQCVMAIQAGELIESESEKDKEFHFLLLHHPDTVIIEGKSYRMKDQTEE